MFCKMQLILCVGKDDRLKSTTFKSGDCFLQLRNAESCGAVWLSIGSDVRHANSNAINSWDFEAESRVTCQTRFRTSNIFQPVAFVCKGQVDLFYISVYSLCIETLSLTRIP